MNNSPDVILGIDIGLSGGLAFFDGQSKELLSVYPMPTVEITKDDKKKNILDIDHLLHLMEIPKVHGESCVVVYETIFSRPGQGVVSVGTLLEQKGIVRGLAKGLGYEECAVFPRTWQKFFGIVPPKDLKGASAAKTTYLRKKWLKNKSLEVARTLYPEWVKKIDANHGISDALLIGLFHLKSMLV